MAAKCPKCGKTLHWYDFRAECKECGANIPNYNWEKRLEEDSHEADVAFAKLHYRLNNFKSGTVGSPFRIVRLVFSLIPLVGLVVPLLKMNLVFPFFEKSESVSFLTMILNYLTKLDFMGGFKLMAGTALGGSVKFLMLALVMAFVAVVAGVLNFFLTIIAAINLKAGINVVLNFLATAFWAASAVLLSMFVTAAQSNSLDVFSGSVVWWGYAIGIALFFANFVISIIISKDFKKQLANQLTLEQAIEKELKEIEQQA